MYKLFNIDNNKKSKIVGLWKGEKIYKDYIHLQNLTNKKDVLKNIKILFDKGEEAVFYEYNKNAYCVYNDGKIDTFTNKTIFTIEKNLLHSVKELLKEYQGLTIYKVKNHYRIEIWSV